MYDVDGRDHIADSMFHNIFIVMHNTKLPIHLTSYKCRRRLAQETDLSKTGFSGFPKTKRDASRHRIVNLSDS